MTDLSKIKPAHTQRRSAFVYVRQSTPSQVEHNRESTQRQYALVDRAMALGWPRDQVSVVDEDLGLSAEMIVMAMAQNQRVDALRRDPELHRNYTRGKSS